MQREDQTDHGNGPGTNSSEGAVNHLSKSVVRESRTPRSMGTGGGRPLPVTRSGPRQRSPATRLMALVLFAQASYGEVLRCLLEGGPLAASEGREHGASQQVGDHQGAHPARRRAADSPL